MELAKVKADLQTAREAIDRAEAGLADEPLVPLEVWHWGTETKDSAYPREQALADLKACGVTRNLWAANLLTEANRKAHVDAFGTLPGTLIAAVHLPMAAKLAAGHKGIPYAHVNDEVKGDGEVQASNAALRDEFRVVVDNPGCVWGHGPWVLKERYGLEKYISVDVMSSWDFSYPNPYVPSCIYVSGQAARMVSPKPGYLCVELIPDPSFGYNVLPPRDCVVRSAMYAALCQPLALAFYGWWRVWNEPGAKETLKLAIDRARAVHREIVGWERVKPDLALVVSKSFYTTSAYWERSICVYQVAAACIRAGVRFDFVWEPEGAAAVMNYGHYCRFVGYDSYGAILSIDGTALKLNKRMTWGRANMLGSTDHWRQDEAEAEADKVPAALRALGLWSYVQRGNVVHEIVQKDDRRKIVAANGAMDWPMGGGPFAGKSVALSQEVEMAGETRLMGPFEFEVVEV
ncbi:MAG: hypothetical protein V2A79_06475 [Planctomycetota bacterium]